MNIVLIVIDTLRYDYVGANGNAAIHTPNLDALVARSWSFDRAFAASYPTIPHRTDAITGRYGAPFHPWKPLDCDVATLPRALSDLGYCTQLIHDTPHLVNGGHCFDYPFHAWLPVQGAEVVRAWIRDSWEFLDNWGLDPLFNGHPGDVKSLREGWGGLGGYMHANHGRTKQEDWNAARVFLTGAEFLRDNASRDNFFLWLDCFDPHEPWDAPPEFMRMYDDTPGYDGTIDPRSFVCRNDPDLSEAASRRIKAAYAAKVSFVDKWLGVFLDTLGELGLAERTAILLTADHGTNVGDREGHPFGKTGPPGQNEGHVPFIVHVPGAGSGRSDMLVQPQDIFATVMGIAGGSAPDGIESYDVLEMAKRGTGGARRLALTGRAVGGWPRSGADAVLFSAFDADWCLGFAANPEKCELKRLGSTENVAADHPDVVSELHAAAVEEIARRGLDPALVEWLRRHGQGECPREFRVTDAHPVPPGWSPYWARYYQGQ